MTAEAVRYNLERYRTSPESVRKGELKSVSAVEVVDPAHVRLVLSQPYAPLIAVLSDRSGMIASPKAIERLGKDFFTAPVCSGPFKFAERVPQDHITLDRFPGYWDAGSIHFDRVIFRPLPDTTVRLVNLQAGQFDMIADLAASDAAKVKADAKLRLTPITGLGYSAINFNLAHGKGADNPFAHDPKLREALDAAIDRNIINQVVMEGMFVADSQSELPNSPFFDHDIPLPPRDLARAKELVRQSGIAHPVLELRLENTTRDIHVAEVIQSMAADAGIEVKVIASEANANIEAMNRGDYQANINDWSGRADPDVNLSVYLACDSFQNFGKYCAPKFQDLLTRAASETDLAKRQALYRQVVATYVEDRPMLFLYHVAYIFAHVAGLKGFTPVPDGMIRLQGMSLN
jgi:peptide/nickel transport system substrate-binding protein